MSVPNPKFQIYKDAKGEFRFRLNAKNGENILASEGYAQKSGAKNGIESVKNNAQSEQFEIKEAKDGKFYFVQKAKNHQVIGTSQMYASKKGAEGGIDAVIRVAPEAGTEDTTESA